VTLNPSNIPAGQTSVETFTVTGIRTSMTMHVNGPNLETGVKVVSARASAKDELELTLTNFTGGAVNPASQVFYVVGL
jgi:hypothetical protein